MAKIDRATVSNRIKVGKPRVSKRYRTKNKASYARTSRSGNGKRLR